jgi:large subunit ribosomal protein L10
MKNPKPSGFSNTRAGKVAILERTKKLVDQSSLVLTIPVQGVTKENTDILRKTLPKTTIASVVKNSIFRKAVEGTDFAPLAEIVRDETMYLFVPEGEAKKTYEAYKKWQKEIKRTDNIYDVKAGAIEGMLVQGANIEVVVNLPTKLELITKIAQGIKAVPTKVARGIKAVPTKVGRAFAAVRDQIEEKEKAGAPVA